MAQDSRVKTQGLSIEKALSIMERWEEIEKGMKELRSCIRGGHMENVWPTATKYSLTDEQTKVAVKNEIKNLAAVGPLGSKLLKMMIAKAAEVIKLSEQEFVDLLEDAKRKSSS